MGLSWIVDIDQVSVAVAVGEELRVVDNYLVAHLDAVETEIAGFTDAVDEQDLLAVEHAGAPKLTARGPAGCDLDARSLQKAAAGRDFLQHDAAGQVRLAQQQRPSAELSGGEHVLHLHASLFDQVGL